MKLILRQYLEGLRERNELDAILPALLSELGFHVLSRPGRGTRQAGVDVAAVGPDERDENKEKLFLFVIKAGDLTRAEWDGNSPQAVRPSINEIFDSYIPTRIPCEYRCHEIAICLCMGGETKEAVITQWTNFQEENTTGRVCFREWNGDKLANLMLSGLLKQDMLPVELRTAFQKSVAMVDQPDVSYRFFDEMARGLRNHNGSDRATLTGLRQLYVCLWVLYVWAREANNLDAPYRASELALLQTWDVCRSIYNKDTVHSKSCRTVLNQTIQLYLNIATDLLDKKVEPYADREFALSRAVNSQSSVDVNLALYEIFGRVSLFGLWKHWLVVTLEPGEERDEAIRWRDRSMNMAIRIIDANSGLLSPIRDDYAIEIALFMMLACHCRVVESVSGFLVGMVDRLSFSIKRRSRYPITSRSYHDLINHPVNQSDDYFRKNTEGSALYPLLIAWLDAIEKSEIRNLLSETLRENLEHCTQQVWLPDEETDKLLWIGRRDHGVAIPGLDLSTDAKAYRDVLDMACNDHPAINDVSAIRFGFCPMFLLACRHYRMPVPPQLWFPGGTHTEVGEKSVSNQPSDKAENRD